MEILIGVQEPDIAKQQYGMGLINSCVFLKKWKGGEIGKSGKGSKPN
jgi:hypothetical protein